MFSRLLELLGWRSPKPSPDEVEQPGDRFPFLRDDPANPVDLVVKGAGLQFVTPAGKSEIIPWKAIRRVRLYCDLAKSGSLLREDGLLYCCAISSQDREDIVLSHLTAEGTKVVDRSIDYRTFILALHVRMLANAARKIDLRAGRTWRWHLLDGAVDAALSDPPWLGLLYTYSIVLFARMDHTMPPAYQVRRRNLPSRYHPAHIPPRVLPSESAP